MTLPVIGVMGVVVEAAAAANAACCVARAAAASAGLGGARPGVLAPGILAILIVDCSQREEKRG